MRRLVRQPGFRDAFYKSDGKGSWRVPSVNESCCIRTNLADLLDAIGAQVSSLDKSISALEVDVWVYCELSSVVTVPSEGLLQCPEMSIEHVCIPHTGSRCVVLATR